MWAGILHHFSYLHNVVKIPFAMGSNNLRANNVHTENGRLHWDQSAPPELKYNNGHKVNHTVSICLLGLLFFNGLFFSRWLENFKDGFCDSNVVATPNALQMNMLHYSRKFEHYNILCWLMSYTHDIAESIYKLPPVHPWCLTSLEDLNADWL